VKSFERCLFELLDFLEEMPKEKIKFEWKIDEIKLNQSCFIIHWDFFIQTKHSSLVANLVGEKN
jgi:hypothetical protein